MNAPVFALTPRRRRDLSSYVVPVLLAPSTDGVSTARKFADGTRLSIFQINDDNSGRRNDI